MKKYFVFLLFTILATVGGLNSMLPRAAAGYPNVLGYRSVCTFAPAASLYCFFLAGLSCIIRAAFVKEGSGQRGGDVKVKLRKHARSFIPLGLILVLALISTFWFTHVKRGYTDATTTATVQE